MTDANLVHILEPQWNPSIEEQAIAKVVRMGQKLLVTIFRYVTTSFVEQVNILKPLSDAVID